MRYSRLACHAWHFVNAFNDMRFTSKPRKTVNGCGTSCQIVKPFGLFAGCSGRAAESWYCERCAVEVYERRCPHCGKLKGDRT